MDKEIKDHIEGTEQGIVGIFHAIDSKWPNVEWFNVDNSYENMTWSDDNDIPKPSKAEIQTEIDRLQVEYNSLLYQKSRAESYPSTGDQLDMIMKDNRDGTTTHKDACEAVKTKWPTDNSGPV
jgi:hypothetical protein